MAGIKWGVTAGIFAAIVSIALGVIFGVALFYIFIRALVFLFIFFALGTGIRMLVDNFFPELTYIEDSPETKISFDQPPSPGSQINISLGGSGEYAVPEMYRGSGDSQELGNIEELISGHFKVRSTVDNEYNEAPAAEERGSGGIDLTTEDDYTIKRDSFSAMPQEFTSFQEPESEPENETSAPVSFEKPVFTPIFGGDSDDLGALPDLGSMATAFSTGFDDMETTAMPHMGDEADSSQAQYNKGNKPQPLQGDFNPQELAQGLRTVLSKDQGR